MISINDTLAKGLAKRVIREISEHKYTSLDIVHLPRRKRIREALKHIKKDNFILHLGSKNKESTKWEMLHGGWSATSKSASINDHKEYDKLGLILILISQINFINK